MTESSVADRVCRGIILATAMTPDRVDEDRYFVLSSKGDREYVVDLAEEACTCYDSRENGNRCKHIYLAALHQAHHHQLSESQEAKHERS